MQGCIRDDGCARIGGYDLFVGLDVDKISMSVSVNDGQTIIRSLTMPYDGRRLLSFVDRHYPGKRALFAYEAGPTGFGLYDSTASAGYD